MQPVLEDLSPESLANANEANLTEFNLLRRLWKHCEVYDDPEMISVVTSIPFHIFNKVFRVRFTPHTVDAGIEKAVARFKSKQVPASWYVGPTTTPTDIGENLEAHGFILADDSPGMAIDLHDLQDDLPEPRELAIEPIRNTEKFKEYILVGNAAFEAPEFVGDAMLELMISIGVNPSAPMQNYLGYLDGRAIAISSVFYGAGVAGIYNVATLPEARGKGIGTAMVTKSLQDAREKGYRVSILQSSAMGYSVYQKIGFRDCCKYTIYVWRPG